MPSVMIIAASSPGWTPTWRNGPELPRTASASRCGSIASAGSRSSSEIGAATRSAIRCWSRTASSGLISSSARAIATSAWANSWPSAMSSIGSAATEPARSALDEGAQPLLHVLAGDQRREIGEQPRRGVGLAGRQRVAAGGQGRVDAERCLLGDDLGDRERARQLLAVLGELLDQADPVGLGGVELVAGEQPAHRVGPPDLARE